MRMTDHVLNATALRSGIAVNSVSLVNQLGKNSQNSLLDALEKGGKPESRNKEGYEKLKKAAEQLSQSIGILAEEGESSVFSKAKASGDYQEVYDSLEALAKNYNNTMKALVSSSSPLDAYYRQMLQEAAAENKEPLAGLGISFSKNGVMSIDKEKLEAADVESLEQAFGGAGSFSSKVAFLSERIFGNAKANAESSSSQYDASGRSYAAYGNMYDIWG